MTKPNCINPELHEYITKNKFNLFNYFLTMYDKVLKEGKVENVAEVVITNMCFLYSNKLKLEQNELVKTYNTIHSILTEVSEQQKPIEHTLN